MVDVLIAFLYFLLNWCCYGHAVSLSFLFFSDETPKFSKLIKGTFRGPFALDKEWWEK